MACHLYFDWLLRAQWSKNALVRFLIPFWAGIELTRIVPIFLDQTWSGFVWNLGLSKMFSFVYSSNSEDLIGHFQRNHCKLVWYFNNRKIVLMLQGILFGAKIVCRQKNVSPCILRAMCTQYISTGCPSEITFDISKFDCLLKSSPSLLLCVFFGLLRPIQTVRT